MQFPTVHNNGSDPAKLATDFLDAARAIRWAIEVMESGSGPHARDYFGFQSTAAFEEARKEHTERLQSLIKVRGELLSLADNVEKQVVEREAAKLNNRSA